MHSSINCQFMHFQTLQNYKWLNIEFFFSNVNTTLDRIEFSIFYSVAMNFHFFKWEINIEPVYIGLVRTRYCSITCYYLWNFRKNSNTKALKCSNFYYINFKVFSVKMFITKNKITHLHAAPGGMLNTIHCCTHLHTRRPPKYTHACPYCMQTRWHVKPYPCVLEQSIYFPGPTFHPSFYFSLLF